MFFVASKVLLFLLQPLNWVFGLILLGLFLKPSPWKRRCFLGAVTIAFLASNPLILNLAYRSWETPPVTMDSLDGTYDVAIVLGGFSDSQKEPFDRLHLSRSATRLTHSLELYHRGLVRTILITGGSGRLLGEKRPEAHTVQAFLETLKFPAEDLLIEAESRNTRENAIYTRTLLEQHSLANARLLLLSDGLHLPRARRCFDKAGLQVTPFATSQRSGPLSPLRWHGLILPDGAGFEATAKLLREIVGTWVYQMRDWA